MFDSYSFDFLRQSCSKSWSFLAGLFTAMIGYILPIKNVVHLVLFFFLLDIIFGYWAARKLRKEHFSTKIIWQYTMPRVLISIVLVMASFMWDTVFKQEFISTYKVIGWFISGVLLFSIAKNGYKITKWEMFPLIGKLLEKKIEEQTGIDIETESEGTR